MNNKKNQRGFVLVFVIAVVSALSIMTGAMFFYYDNDLKSVSRNSVMQQVNLAAETGLQEGQKWITDQLNSNSFTLVDIQNTLHVDDSDNKCLNRHGFTNSSEDVYYAKKISANLGVDDPKFEDMSYEVFVQRHADVVRSIYFSEQGDTNNNGRDAIYTDRSFALVERFKDFPSDQFTIEMWIKNMQEDSDNTYNMHAFEYGRLWDLVFKIKNNDWSPRLGEVVLAGDGSVGTPVKGEWVHIAWVWDGGTPGSTDTDNVRIYQNGELVGTYDADIGARSAYGYTNTPETLPGDDHWPLAIGEGLQGFDTNSYLTGKPIIQSVPWLGNIAEMRIWNVSRSETDIANNNRRRLTGSEPGLVSYYKFNEGSGNTAKDFNTSRAADRKNDATIYGIGNKGTLWKTEILKYPVTSTTDDEPSINVPPGEDVVYYKILSCGNGPQGQIVPLELIVSAPVQKGDVGTGKIALTEEDLNDLTGQEGTPLKISLNTYIGQEGVTGEINIDNSGIDNTNIPVFKRAMEQCNNLDDFTTFSEASSYNEGDCAEFEDVLYYLENDLGKSSGTAFIEDDWVEVLGSGCDGVQFKPSADDDPSYGHYYKYFSTAPNVTGSEIGYRGNSIDWWEAKRRAEASTCGGMRGYLVSIESADENEFIKDAVMCNNSTDSGCTGVTPFHVAAGETRENYYGTRLDSSSDQHFIWLSNSDWRSPTANATNMRSESGPNMGILTSELNSSFTVPWQSGEPNNAAEPYADMEINRSGRVNGNWNDLRRFPNCTSGGLDCITGYVVEYGGFDYFRLNHDDPDDENDDVDSDTKFCVARATIEKDKYVGPSDLNSDGDYDDDNETEDFLKYVTTSEDAPSTISADTSSDSDSDTSDDWPGWNLETGVLTLVHDDKPSDWDPASNYSEDDFVWYNNRVWQAEEDITGGSSLDISKTPTIYNPEVWTLFTGNESNAPCADVDVWDQAFESIYYFNNKVVEAEEGENPYANEGTDGTDGTELSEDDDSLPSLGERTILFSLGPLHVEEHRDGYNHFYEFYEFPRRASGNSNNDIFNDRNRRMNEAFSLARQLEYFGKSAYLATITSESENDIVTEKAVGNGWMGGLTQSANQTTPGDLNKCGGFSSENLSDSSDDFLALKKFDTIKFYRGGQAINTTDKYLRNIIEKYTSSSSPPTSKSITAISTATPARLTVSNHGLDHDDIIRINDVDSGVTDSDEMQLDGTSYDNTGFYRVVVVNNNSFDLVHLDTREPINGNTFFNGYSGDGEMWELEGIQNEFYRNTNTSNISSANSNPQSQSGMRLIYKDPKIALANGKGVEGSGGDVEYSSGTRTKNYFDDGFFKADDRSHSDCSIWRWMTGPEQFIYNNRGLAFAPTRKASNSPSANNGTWTRSAPTGQQVGEVFVDGMPFRNWNGTGEPNDVKQSEHGIHLLGTHFPDSAELTWNDLHNWNNGPDDSYSDYSIRGLVLEYGGLENVGDPVVRIATKRTINLYDRRVTKAVIKIKSGSQSGDKLVVGADELSEFSLTATNNETSTVTISGDGLCQNYLDLVKSMHFEHNASTAGTREIEVLLGDVQKPTGAEHYYQLNDTQLSYNQANFQSSYKNLCGIQGYLANVTTSADLDAIKALGVSNDKQAWVNGTDECQGGIYRPGFWRYTSGPWKDKEFWRLRINFSNTQLNNIENEASCNVNSLRSSQNSVRVGPFNSNNWVSSHPAANTNDYLAFQQTTNSATTGILTRDGAANSDVEGYIVRFGGSVGDFIGATIEEDDNNINVLLGPIRAEVSFYDDGTDNSIFIDDEDTVKIDTSGDISLSTGWSRTAEFDGSGNTPLKITPPSGEVPTIAEWRDELEKVYYQNTDTSDFTPGNRKIKIKLVYNDTTLNQEIGVVKAIGSRNAVTVTPISWNNR